MKHPLVHKLKGARGKQWGELIKRVYYAIGPDLAEDGRRHLESGTLTIQDLANLATAYGLGFKTTCEFLQELPRDKDAPLSAVERKRTGIHSKPILPTGTYSDLKERGLKVSQFMEVQQW